MDQQSASSDKEGGRARPLSPHLQIYKWQFTMVTSIAHRASGIILAGGLVVLILALVMIMIDPHNFDMLQYAGHTMHGRLFLFLWVWAYSYHLCNGLRHLAWDIGWGFSLEGAARNATLVGAGSFILAIIIFAVGYGVI